MRCLNDQYRYCAFLFAAVVILILQYTWMFYHLKQNVAFLIVLFTYIFHSAAVPLLLSHWPYLCISPLDSAVVDRIVNSANTVIEGEYFSMTCYTSGEPRPNVYWIKVSNGARINGSILNFTNINRNDIDQYRCEAENDCGNNNSVRSIEVFCKYETTPWLCFSFDLMIVTNDFYLTSSMVLIILLN